MSTGFIQVEYPAGHPSNYETQMAEYEREMAELAAGTLVPPYEGYEPYKPSKWNTTHFIPTPNKSGTASSRDVIGRFLERKASNREARFYTDGRAIYSYGSHWRLAYHDDGGDGSIKWDVNMWRSPYSSTTSGHMSDVRRDPRLWGKVTNIDIFPEVLKGEVADAMVRAARGRANMADFNRAIHNVIGSPSEAVMRECFERARTNMAKWFADGLKGSKSGAVKKTYTKESVAAYRTFITESGEFYVNLLTEYEKRYFKAYGEKMPPIPIRKAPVEPQLVKKMDAQRRRTLTEKKGVLVWHFLASDLRLRFNDGRLTVVGETLSVNKTPEMCVSGLHGSRKMSDAYRYYTGTYVQRAVIFGCVEEIEDKLDGQHRKCLGIADVSEMVRVAKERGIIEQHERISDLMYAHAKECEQIALELMGLQANSREAAKQEDAA